MLGRVLVADTAHLGTDPSPTPKTFYAACSLRAGDDSDYNQVRGGWGLGNIVPATMMLLHESTTPVQVTLKCSLSGMVDGKPREPSAWANARITAVQVRSSVVKPPVAGPVTGGGAKDGAASP